MAHYAFDLDFQKHILAAFLADEKFTRENFDVLQAEYFNDELLQGIAESLKIFVGKFKTLPGQSTLCQEIKQTVAAGRKFTEYRETIAEIFKLCGNNTEYYQEKAQEFAKAQIMAGALRRSLELLDKGELNEILPHIQFAGRSMDRTDDAVYNYFAGVRNRAAYYQNLRDPVYQNGRVKTGFHPLDERIGGGLGPGETGVIVGLPGHGKTTTLVNLAVAGLITGRKTLYVTLELGKKMIAGKFDAKLFGQSMDAMKKKPKSFFTAMNKVREKITSELIIAEYPTKSLTLTALQAVIEKAAPQLVLIDYAALLKPPYHNQERRHNLTEVHEGIRRIAGESKVPIWTAHQANRPGTGAKTLSIEHIAEDFNIMAVCDIGISINQTLEEQRLKKCRFFIMKNRLGASSDVINCSVDWPTSNIQLAYGDDEDDFS